MNISQNGIDLIKQFEGLRLEAYQCSAGVWTIGFGHTNGVKQGDKITLAQAEDFLRSDLEKFENAINNLVNVELNQNQFDALVSFVFNIGINAFKKSTMLKFLNNNSFPLAAGQFDRWIYANGNVVAGLINRRKKEKELFLSEITDGCNPVSESGSEDQPEADERHA